MTKPLKKTKRFCAITVFVMLTVALSCFTTACTSPKVQVVSASPIPDEVVQPIEDSDTEVSVDKTLTEETPAIDNTNLIPIEEAEQIAKEYAASHYDLELEKLATSFKDTDTCKGELFYSFCFDYGDGDGYSISMWAATGQIDGVGHGTND